MQASFLLKTPPTFPMRILLVGLQDQEIGGVASVVGNLAKYLITQGHQVFFFHPTAAILMRRKINRFGFPSFNLRMQMPFGERNPAISLLAFLVLFPIILFQLFYLVQTYKIQVINIHYPAEYL